MEGANAFDRAAHTFNPTTAPDDYTQALAHLNQEDPQYDTLYDLIDDHTEDAAYDHEVAADAFAQDYLNGLHFDSDTGFGTIHDERYENNTRQFFADISCFSTADENDLLLNIIDEYGAAEFYVGNGKRHGWHRAGDVDGEHRIAVEDEADGVYSEDTVNAVYTSMVDNWTDLRSHVQEKEDDLRQQYQDIAETEEFTATDVIGRPVGATIRFADNSWNTIDSRLNHGKNLDDVGNLLAKLDSISQQPEERAHRLHGETVKYKIIDGDYAMVGVLNTDGQEYGDITIKNAGRHGTEVDQI